MPDYHHLRLLCGEVARELEAAEHDETWGGERDRLNCAEDIAIVLYRQITVARIGCEANKRKEP